MNYKIGEKVKVSDIIDGKDFGGEFIIKEINKIKNSDIYFIYFEGTGLVATIEQISKI